MCTVGFGEAFFPLQSAVLFSTLPQYVHRLPFVALAIVHRCLLVDVDGWLANVCKSMFV